MHRSMQDPPGLPGPEARDRMGADASLDALCRLCGSFGAAGRWYLDSGNLQPPPAHSPSHLPFVQPSSLNSKSYSHVPLDEKM